MKTILAVFVLAFLSQVPCSADHEHSAELLGKWYRVVPGCSLFLEFHPDGKCSIERRWYDGLEDHSSSIPAKWYFDGWCLVLTPIDAVQGEKVLQFPVRLSLIELGTGEHVLGCRLRWDAHEENIQADVFRRGEFKFAPPTSPDKSARKP